MRMCGVRNLYGVVAKCRYHDSILAYREICKVVVSCAICRAADGSILDGDGGKGQMVAILIHDVSRDVGIAMFVNVDATLTNVGRLRVVGGGEEWGSE